MNRGDAFAGPPADFLDRMWELLLPEEFAAFQSTFNHPPNVGLRVNTLKISVADFSSIAPFPLAPVGEWEPAGFLVTDNSRPGRHPYHDAGLYYLQEPSAMVASALLAPSPGEVVLDLAAAPGGKATHLASLMVGAPAAEPASPLKRALDTSGLLVANDVHAGRARLLADNLARWGALNVLVTQGEPERVAEAFGPLFDSVLVDAPCSGEGMFRRREDVEWSEAIVAACARRQRSVLAIAPRLLRPGGRLLYSTCTFAPEENEQVIAAFLAHQPDFSLEEPQRFPGFERGRPEWSASSPAIAEQLERTIRLWPHLFQGEGHFLALMRRGRGGSPEGGNERFFKHRPPSPEEFRLWREFADAALALSIPAERLHAHNGRLYLLPKTTLAPGRVRVVRYGLLLGEARPGRFHPAHDLALAMASSDVLASIDWPAQDPQLAAYLSGADVAGTGVSGSPSGWALVTVGGYGLGWGKQVGGRLKNHYPHHLRRRL